MIEDPKTSQDHRFGYSNQQVSDHRMRKQPRLDKKIDDLNQLWALLNEKLNRLKAQFIFETKIDEQFRLEKLINATETQYNQVEKQLEEAHIGF